MQIDDLADTIQRILDGYQEDLGLAFLLQTSSWHSDRTAWDCSAAESFYIPLRRRRVKQNLSLDDTCVLIAGERQEEIYCCSLSISLGAYHYTAPLFPRLLVPGLSILPVQQDL